MLENTSFPTYHKLSVNDFESVVMQLFQLLFLFQISDIVVGQEDLSAKEALLRWAQKTTHKYPGVRVQVRV